MGNDKFYKLGSAKKKLILKMSKHIQLISHYPPHERIKTFLMKKKDTEMTVTQISQRVVHDRD